MGPVLAKVGAALLPSFIKAAEPLIEKTGHTLLDVFSHSAKTYVNAYGNLINAVADRIRGPAAAAYKPQGGP
jgi:hypothetical protein